jgi:hypothetical protein
MASIKLELTRQEVYNAIFEYVRRQYPHLDTATATINSSYGKITGATVAAQLKKQNPFTAK